MEILMSCFGATFINAMLLFFVVVVYLVFWAIVILGFDEKFDNLIINLLMVFVGIMLFLSGVIWMDCQHRFDLPITQFSINFNI